MDRRDTLLELGTVARMLGKSTSHVRKAETDGRLPAAVRLESGRRVWFAEDLADVLSRPTQIRSSVRGEGPPLEAA